MLLPLKYADLWQMESHCGRCCNHFIGWLVDVVAKVTDEIATLVNGRCYCHCGRWNDHIGWNGSDYGRCYCIVADGMATGSSVFYFVFIFIYFILFYLSSEMLNRDVIPYVRQMVLAYNFCLGMDCWPLCVLILL